MQAQVVTLRRDFLFYKQDQERDRGVNSNYRDDSPPGTAGGEGRKIKPWLQRALNNKLQTELRTSLQVKTKNAIGSMFA